MQEPTHYEILEVSPGASYPEIKKAYRRLAQKHHPDKNPGAPPEQQARFARIAGAYAVLSDLRKRREYDARLAGHERQRQGTAAGEGQRQAPPPPQGAPYYYGYPLARFDIFTPFFHSLFMGADEAPKSREQLFRHLLFNWRILLAAVFGALFYFKFFAMMDGVVLDKRVDSDLFNLTTYSLVLKTGAEGGKTKRVKSELYDKVQPNDRVQKALFSFTYLINDEEFMLADPPRFLLQVILIYLAIGGGLFLLERAK